MKPAEKKALRGKRTREHAEPTVGSAEGEPTRGYRPSGLGRIVFFASYLAVVALGLGAFGSDSEGHLAIFVLLAGLFHLVVRLYQWFRDRNSTWIVEGEEDIALGNALVKRWMVRAGTSLLEFFGSLLVISISGLEALASTLLLIALPSLLLSIYALIMLGVRRVPNDLDKRIRRWILRRSVEPWIETHRELDRERLELERERLELERERLELERKENQFGRDL